MFFSWTDEIHEKRKIMKDIINKAREENEPLASWKNRLEGNGFTRETVSHLSYAGVELMVFLGVNEDEFKALGYTKWIM